MSVKKLSILVLILVVVPIIFLISFTSTLGALILAVILVASLVANIVTYFLEENDTTNKTLLNEDEGVILSEQNEAEFICPEEGDCKDCLCEKKKEPRPCGGCKGCGGC